MEIFMKISEYKNAIIITGANGGIGFECTKQFCETHTKNTIIAISRKLNNLKPLVYSNLLCIECDVNDYQKIKAEIGNIVNHGNYIDGLINCAGTSFNGDFCNIGINKIQEMIDTNISGLTNMIDVVLPYMRKQKTGTIINISSLSDRYPRPNATIYAATKAYVKSLSDSLRVSEAKYNIRVNNISPAIINTPLLHTLGKDSGQTIDVKDFVNVLKFIYEQPQSICIRDIVIAPTTYEN